MGYYSKLLIAMVYSLLVCVPVSARDKPPVGTMISAQALPHDDDVQGYQEFFLDDPANDEFRAVYRSVDGRPIAHKRLRYSGTEKHPTFEMHDYRNASGYRVVPMSQRLRVERLKLLENNIQAVVDVQEVIIVEPTVIDASFHRFLMEQWSVVERGEVIKFNFLQLDKARLVPMELKRTDCSSADLLCVRITLSNFFYRAFVPPVLLTYEKSTRRLLHYSGYGPLPTEAGRALPVTLDYRYVN